MITFDQTAIASDNARATVGLFIRLGFDKWTKDIVTARGIVRGKIVQNKAILYFNYELTPGKEFEVLQYTEGDNWLNGRIGLSHMGAHVDDLESAMEQMSAAGYQIIQDVHTINHTNHYITKESPRRYHYVIYDCYENLGFDIKLIKRIMA